MLQWKNMYTLHVISLNFKGNPCKFCMDISKKLGYYMFSLHLLQGIPVVSLQNQILCKYYNRNQSVDISNYRDCGYTCNPHKFEIPALRFPCRVPAIPCKHLQCSPVFVQSCTAIFFNSSF